MRHSSCESLEMVVELVERVLWEEAEMHLKCPLQTADTRRAHHPCHCIDRPNPTFGFSITFLFLLAGSKASQSFICNLNFLI